MILIYSWYHAVVVFSNKWTDLSNNIVLDILTHEYVPMHRNEEYVCMIHVVVCLQIFFCVIRERKQMLSTNSLRGTNVLYYWIYLLVFNITSFKKN